MKQDSASATASVVALGCLCELKETGVPQGERVVPLLEAFLSARGIAAPHRLAAMHSGSSWVRRFLRGTMDLVIPGMFAHYVARKAFIEERVRGLIAEGRRQLVVVAGGFDTLSLRLAQDFPDLRVIEIDHPATQAVKREALRQTPALPQGVPANLRFVASDLAAEPLGEVLSRGGFDPGLATVFVLEGFLMYLPEAAVAHVFQALAGACKCASEGTPPSVCVFTVMSVREDGVVGFTGGRVELVDAWLARQRERFLWGIAATKLPAFLQSKGWSWSEGSTLAEMQRFHAGANRALAVGESIHVARLSLAQARS